MRDELERYIPVSSEGSTSEPQSKAYFMIRGLLSSRVDVGLPTESSTEEQDVNIYLAHLLSSYIDPEYCLRVADYLSTYNSSLFERIQHSTSNRFKYTVYRINADHLLMSIGVFQNPTGRRPDSLGPAFQQGEESYVGRGKTYYDFASTYSQSIFGRSSGVKDVLWKLSNGFEKYVRILSHMRGEYLNFLEQLKEGELYHLQQGANLEGLNVMRNEFLDLYSAYQRNPTEDAKTQLLEVSEQLKKLDPHFTFDLPE